MSTEKENIDFSSGKREEPLRDEHKESEKKSAEHNEEEIDELDEKVTSFGRMLRRSLSGDVLAKDAIKSQAGVIVIIAFFIFLCTSNRYSCQQAHVKEEKLKQELSDAKNRAFSSFSLLTEKSRKSKLQEGLKAMNDSSLEAGELPPYIVEVPQEETDEE